MKCMEDIVGDSINSWLIRVIHGYSSVNFKRFKKMGIHPGQFPVLKMVSEQEGINLRELADALHIKPPTVTVTVQRLEKAGLVYKKADDGDQRVSRIYLTEDGRAIQMQIIRLINENERLLTAGFSEEELEQLRSFFQRMTVNLLQVDGEQRGRQPMSEGK